MDSFRGMEICMLWYTVLRGKHFHPPEMHALQACIGGGKATIPTTSIPEHVESIPRWYVAFQAEVRPQFSPQYELTTCILAAHVMVKGPYSGILTDPIEVTPSIPLLTTREINTQ